jgi:hypothetical protein
MSTKGSDRFEISIGEAETMMENPTQVIINYDDFLECFKRQEFSM